MKPADILRMIEEVSPDDTGKLDEIDARVYFYLAPDDLKYYRTIENYISGVRIAELGGAPGLRRLHPQYTRSRDALKSIRPEGYFIREGGHWRSTGEFYFLLYSATGVRQFYVDAAPTEELAELAAIIQAIAYERGGG